MTATANKIIDATLRFQDKFTGKMDAAIQKMELQQKSVAKFSKKIEGTGKSITKVGKTLSTAVTAPIVALGTKSVLNFGNVDKSLKLVEATMGDAKWATGDLKTAIEDAAASSVFNMQDAADASVNFARQGFNAKESAEMLKPALSLAAGTATDLSDVTSGLGNTMKAFAKDGLTAKNVADIYAQAQAQANTTTSELFDAMSVGAPIFSTVGWSLQDLAAVTGVFGDASISGSEGATAMKTGLAKLVSPAKEGAAWIEKLGLNVTNSDGTMKDMVTVQGQLHNAFSKLTQEEQMQAASAIFGKNQMSRWLKLIQTAPSTVKNYRDSLDEVTGTADKMADSLMSGVGGSIEKLKSTFDVFKFKIGEQLGDSVKKAVDKVTDLLDRFNHMDPATQKVIVKIAMLAAAIGPALILVGKSIIGISKVMKAGKTVIKGFKLLRGAMGLLNIKVLAIIAVVAVLAGAAYLIYKNWDHIKAFFISLGEKFKEFGAKVKDVFINIKNWVVETATNIFNKIKNFVAAAVNQGGVIGAIFQNISNRINAMKQIFGGIITFIKGVFTGNWKSAWEGVKQIFSGIFANLASVLKAPLNGVIGLVNGAIRAINKIHITIPDWVPGIGGKSFGGNLSTIPYLYRGTNHFSGGSAVIHDKGAEIVNLPRGTQVIPHDRSLQIAYNRGKQASGGKKFRLEKLADTIIIREDADIEKIAQALADKLDEAGDNMGDVA